MAREGRSVSSFLLGAVAGLVVGYVLATDKETRKEDLEKVKNSLSNLKEKFAKKEASLEEDIFHS
jgi:uncharacterized membrane-anchored protein YhcB (DUF1043 family)